MDFAPAILSDHMPPPAHQRIISLSELSAIAQSSPLLWHDTGQHVSEFWPTSIARRSGVNFITPR